MIMSGITRSATAVIRVTSLTVKETWFACWNKNVIEVTSLADTTSVILGGEEGWQAGNTIIS